jgi:drug/metabolite transporter (DMT)-like permease
MVGAMALFSLADLFIKLAQATMGQGQVILALGLGGYAAFAALAVAQGQRLADRAFFHPAVVGRNLSELLGMTFMITALALVPLSTVAAIMQASPLMVTLGAALFLGEPVGWRRWAAVAAGFAGMLLILRPGLDGADPNAVFAVIATLAMSGRDLFTRRVPPGLSTPVLASYGVALTIPLGLVWALAADGAVLPPAPDWPLIAAMVIFGTTGYFAITQAVRMAPVSVVAPFRYSRLVFAMALGMAVFGERPDLPTLAGAALIVGSGLYALARENRVRRRLHSRPAPR